MHPAVEATLTTHPGVELHGIDEVERFLRGLADERAMFEAVATEVRCLDERCVVAQGRVRWMDDQRVLRDDPVVWALELEDGLLRRSTPVRTVSEAEALLSTAPSQPEE